MVRQVSAAESDQAIRAPGHAKATANAVVGIHGEARAADGDSARLQLRAVCPIPGRDGSLRAESLGKFRL